MCLVDSLENAKDIIVICTQTRRPYLYYLHEDRKKNGFYFLTEPKQLHNVYVYISVVLTR